MEFCCSAILVNVVIMVVIRFILNFMSDQLYVICNMLFFPALAVRSFRVITGCGSHGVGKSKLKESVRPENFVF